MWQDFPLDLPAAIPTGLAGPSVTAGRGHELPLVQVWGGGNWEGWKSEGKEDCRSEIKRTGRVEKESGSAGGAKLTWQERLCGS